MIKKTIQRSDDCFIQFTEEELAVLNIKPGDKFSWEIKEDSIVMHKHVPLEIDLSEFSRETLEMLIINSVEKDISVNDVITEAIEHFITKNDE